MKKYLAVAIVIVLALSTLAVRLPVASASDPSKDQEALSPLADTSILNQYIEIAVADPGATDIYGGEAEARFTLGSTGGNPANPNDDGQMLLFGHPTPWSSFSTIRIDGSDYKYGSSQGSFSQDPTSDTNWIKSVWATGSVQVTQVLTLVLNPASNRYDAMEISYTLDNLDLVSSHDVGLRVLLDTKLGDNDGAPFQVPGTGAISTEHEYVGTSVPDYWQAFDSLDNPTVLSQGTLRGGDATAPDRLLFAGWYDLYRGNNYWDYTVTPGRTFAWPNNPDYLDSSVTMYWNPKSLLPGQSIAYSTYYGIGELSQSLLPPFSLSVAAPQSLSVVNNAYSPNPFTVTAYVQNISADVISSIDLTISLPQGLNLAGSLATQTIANIAVNQVESVWWYVSASNQTSETLLNYTVDAVASVGTKTVTLSLLIPAIDNAVQPPTANAGGPYTVNEGSCVTLTGSGTDPQGLPLTYAWDLNGDGVYETPGQLVPFCGVDGPKTVPVALQVCNSAGLCATATTTVTINNVAPATIDFDPDTLNMKSHGKVVTVYIELPNGYYVGEIDVSSIRLNGTVPALAKPTAIGDYDKDGIPDLMVKFDRAAVQAILAVGDQVEVTISGKVLGFDFEGTDTIRVIN